MLPGEGWCGSKGERCEQSRRRQDLDELHNLSEGSMRRGTSNHTRQVNRLRGNRRTNLVESLLSVTLARRRFTMMVLTSFAALAMALAAIAMYGVMRYAAARRRSEMGILR